MCCRTTGPPGSRPAALRGCDPGRRARRWRRPGPPRRRCRGAAVDGQASGTRPVGRSGSGAPPHAESGVSASGSPPMRMRRIRAAPAARLVAPGRGTARPSGRCPVTRADPPASPRRARSSRRAGPTRAPTSTACDCSASRLLIDQACPTRHRKRIISRLVQLPEGAAAVGAGPARGDARGGRRPRWRRGRTRRCSPSLSMSSIARGVSRFAHGFGGQSDEGRGDRPQGQDVVHLDVLDGVPGHARIERLAGVLDDGQPPLVLMAARPALPSSRAPVRTTPMTRPPYQRAAVRKSGSTAGRWPFSRAADQPKMPLVHEHVHGPGGRCRCGPARSARRRPGAARAGRRTGTGSPAGGWCRARGTCSTTPTAAGRSAGRALTSRQSASTPPPMPR